MANPIVVPPVMTAEEKFARLMQNPQIRERARRDPLFADRLMQSLRVPDNRSQGPQIDPYQRSNYLQPSVGTTLGRMPDKGMSVADFVRKQRDAFLVNDGMQVAGDYTTAIRKEVGGIPAPSMPPVGYAAAQSYRYPSQKMVVGAALAGGPTLTTTRGMLPTSSFNPGAFVTARPDAQGNNLITNDPASMPRRALPRSSLVTNPNKFARLRNARTLSGLGAADATFMQRHDPNKSAYQKSRDPWDILVTAFTQNADAVDDPDTLQFFEALLGGIDRLYNEKDIAYYKRMKCDKIGQWQDIPFCFAEKSKGLARFAITAVILADKIDLSLIPVGGGKNVNDWLNENLINLVPPDLRMTVQSFTNGGKIFPLDIKDLGLRRYLLEEIYAEIFPRAELKEAWYEALSNELLNRKSASMIDAINILRTQSEKYRPDAKTVPMTPLKPGIAPITWDDVPRADKAKKEQIVPKESKGEMNTTLLIAGGVAAVALIGLGLFLKRK